MLQASVVGYLGADAEVKNVNGQEFTTCRVAHTDRWKDQAGQTHESTQWIDLTLNGKPAVVDYLKQGTMVYAAGHVKLRCYSSEKARGFVAGMTISVVTIELLGGNSDAVPARLYDASGNMVDVVKYYHCELSGAQLTNGRGKLYVSDDNGWVLPLQQAPTNVQQAVNQANQDAEATESEPKKDDKKTK